MRALFAACFMVVNPTFCAANDPSFSFRLRDGGTAFDRAGQQALIDRFFSGFPGEIETDSSTSYRLGGGGLNVSMVWKNRFGRQYRYRAEVELFHSRSRMTFPDGLSVFADPAVVEIKATGFDVSLHARVAETYFWQRKATLMLGGGVAMAHVAARYDSDLLRVRAKTDEVVGYLRLRATQEMLTTENSPILFAEVSTYESNTVELRFGLELGF